MTATVYSEKHKQLIYNWRVKNHDYYLALQRKYKRRRLALQRAWKELAPLGDLYLSSD